MLKKGIFCKATSIITRRRDSFDFSLINRCKASTRMSHEKVVESLGLQRLEKIQFHAKASLIYSSVIFSVTLAEQPV
jgi:hypothetical protein